MQRYSSTGDVSLGTVVVARFPEEVEALIVACSEAIRAMAVSFARGSVGCLDPDDLYSLAMVEMCEAVAAGRLARARNPLAYLKQVARYAMVEEWRRVSGQSTASLDAPLSGSSDDSLTLQGVLAAPLVAAPAGVTRRERAVRQALECLTPRRRAVLQRRFGLTGYGPHTLKETGDKLRASVSAVSWLQRRGLDDLAQDAGLLAAVVAGSAMSSGDEEARDGAEVDHTPAYPYCKDMWCWCHSDVAYHQVVTTVSQPMDDQQVQVLYACFGLAGAEEVAR